MASTSNLTERERQNKEKEFEHNSYATRKTVTQGLLDIALLVANASQLKLVLDMGEAHDYYVLMITLISISIFLQLVRGCLNVVLGSLYNIGLDDHQTAATVINNVVLGLGAFTTVVNAIIAAFDMS